MLLPFLFGGAAGSSGGDRSYASVEIGRSFALRKADARDIPPFSPELPHSADRLRRLRRAESAITLAFEASGEYPAGISSNARRQAPEISWSYPFLVMRIFPCIFSGLGSD
jgi:hypothetical protein